MPSSGPGFRTTHTRTLFSGSAPPPPDPKPIVHESGPPTCAKNKRSYRRGQGNLKGGIGSRFDPVLTLWGGGHIGSSRMEQSYCTSGFFRQCVTARNHSNYQPTPRRRSITAYGKRENARRDKCVAVCVICFIFLAALFYAFQTFPGKAQLFSRFFLLLFFVFCFLFSPFVLSAVIDMSDP